MRAIYDVEEATSTAFDIILGHKVNFGFFLWNMLLFFISYCLKAVFYSVYAFMQMIKSETRASLIKFLQFLVTHHPSRRFVRRIPVYNCFAQSAASFIVQLGFLLGVGREVQNSLSTLMRCTHLIFGQTKIRNQSLAKERGL